MAIEIERKFLVKSTDFIDLAIKKYKITQAYISRSKDANVRVRLKNDTGFITIKGKSDKNRMSRKEWEFEIPKTEALELIAFSKTDKIEKTRYLIPEQNGLMFEVDVFEGKNKGLIVAEIELESENQEFITPYWIDKEVTKEKRYYNSSLSKNPFSEW